LGEERFVAHARVLSFNPDYAPDRRTFYSVADDLADRDLAPAAWDCDKATLEEVGDLFQRVFETMSLMNVDAVRFHGIDANPAQSSFPRGTESIPRPESI